MRRRKFLAGAGIAAMWPLAARAQQAVPVIGFLNPVSAEAYTQRLRGFHRGLKEAGYVEGDNITIDYRWADNHLDRLPALTADLVRRRVAVIVASPGTAQAAKAATKTIPIVFLASDDPVKLGLVASLSRPGGNMTGINFLNTELTAKRLEMLRQLIPDARRIAVLINPTNPENANTALQAVESAGRTMGLQIQIVRAGTNSEIDAAFASLARERPDALRRRRSSV